MPQLPAIDRRRPDTPERRGVCGATARSRPSLFLALQAPAAAVPRRGGGRRQDRDREGLVRALGRTLIRLQCYEGLDVASAVYEWNYAGQMMAIRLAEPAGAPIANAGGATCFRDRYLVQAAAAAGPRAAYCGRSGAPDRRARPHGRGVRGLSARGSVRFPGDRAGIRNREGGASADRDHYLEPDPRNSRRPQAALPLPLGRLPGCDARARDPEIPRSRRPGELSAGDRRFRSGDPERGAVQGAGCRRDARLGVGACVELDAVALDPALVSDTLGVLLKYQDDIQKMQGSRAKAMLDQVSGDIRAAE